MSNSQKKKKSKHPIDERAFTIGLAVIIPFTILTFVLLLVVRDLDSFKDVGAIYGAWLGIVIGYFFGSRKVEALTEKVDEFMDNMECSYDEYENEYNELEDDFNDIKNKYEKAKNELQHVISSNSQNMDKEFLKRLKDEHDIIINEKQVYKNGD